MISYGASPRAGIGLAQAAKAFAFIKRRGYVIPEDVRAVCPDVLRHRIGLSYEAEANNITSEEIIADLIGELYRDWKLKSGNLSLNRPDLENYLSGDHLRSVVNIVFKKIEA